MISKIFTPITAVAAAGTSSGAASNVGSSRYILVQNTAAAGTDYLITLEESGGTDIGTFRINGNSSMIIKKGTTNTIFAENAAVFLTGITVTNI